MKVKNYIFILLLLCGSYLHSQSISDSDKIFIDSLITTKTTVFIIDEYCSGCGKAIGERKPANQAKSCSYNDSYLIIWLDKDSKQINSKMANSCYELFSVSPIENRNFDKVNLLFNRLLKDSINNEIWVEPAQLDSTNQFPITGSTFYKFTKLDGSLEYSINFNENLFNNNSEVENTKSVEFLLNEILIEFYEELARLVIEGEKININWH